MNIYRNNIKLKHNFISTIIEKIRTGANCECCGTYDSWVYNLDCGHQLGEYIELNQGDKVQCEDCYYDKNGIYIDTEYFNKFGKDISNDDEVYDKTIFNN